MEALTFHAIEDIRHEEKPKPTIDAPTDVIVKVSYASICGSDLSRYKKLGPKTPGNIFGHECSGVIHEVGEDVPLLKKGEPVAVCPQLTCGKCDACLSGHLSACPNLLVIGAKEPGGFASYVKVPKENVLKLPSEVSTEEAVAVEPSAVVLHGLYKTKLQPGKTVAVYGCGTIGLLSIQWAKLFGAKNVYAIELEKDKLEIAEELGAEIILPTKSQSSYDQLMQLTNGKGVDLAVEAAGSATTSEEVFAAPKKGGEVVFLGIPYSDVLLKRFYFERIVRHELTVYGGWNAISAPFPGREFHTTLQFLQEKKLKIKPLISHCLPLDEGPEMFRKMTNGEEKAVKVIFKL